MTVFLVIQILLLFTPLTETCETFGETAYCQDLCDFPANVEETKIIQLGEALTFGPIIVDLTCMRHYPFVKVRIKIKEAYFFQTLSLFNKII
jgi:hypothetical protein